MRIAFYAPLKAPDHPVPSGDRAMARLTIRALRTGAHDVEVISDLRSFVTVPEPARCAAIEAAAGGEIARIIDRWAGGGAPDLWFTYHPFYKAPDLIGPALAQRFGLPYVTLEASHAGKRATGAWEAWHRRTEAAIRAGTMHFCLTDRDRSGIETLLGPTDRIMSLRPFIDAAPSPERHPPSRSTVELIAVAMMRPGDKTQSYTALARALEHLPEGLDWHLNIVGDGPVRDAVMHEFGSLPARRLAWSGQLEAPDVLTALRAADLFVWPGCNEAYGIAYLEAAASGLPALAFDSGGISSVVRDGATGVLVPDGDVKAYSSALAVLIRDRALRDRLGAAAEVMVRTERSLTVAAGILDRGLARATKPPTGP